MTTIKVNFNGQEFQTDSNVSFYDALNEIKRCRGARYNLQTKIWTVYNSSGNKEILKGVIPDIEPKEEKEKSKEKLNKLLNSIKEKYPFLYDFQARAVLKGVLANKKYNGFLLGFEQGLGKTVTSIITAQYMNHNRIWVVVPAALMSQWEREIKYWTGDEDVQVYNKPKKKRLKEYESPHKWNIISYDTLRNDSNQEMLQRAVLGGLLISDESTKFKNIQSKLYKNFKYYLNDRFQYRIFMSGTPVNNNLKDINNVINLIDLKLTGRIDEFIIYEPMTVFVKGEKRVVNEIVGYRNLDEYNRRIKPVYKRERKEDVAQQLPGKNIITEKFNTESIYSSQKQTIVNEISPFSGFTYLLGLDSDKSVIEQGEGEYVDLIELPESEYNPKIDYLKEFLEGLNESNEQCLIFTRFHATANKLYEKLKDLYNIKSTTTHNNEELKEEFENNQVKFVIATDKWSRGVSFPNVDYMINFDISASIETYLQRQDRIHRINSTRPKFIYNLVGNVIETYVMDILNEKLELIENVTEGKASSYIDESSIKKEVMKKLGYGVN
ncbi:MAG: DEAD/DEAH box helicase [Candidatus Woesearchaeota archaeon]